MQGQSLLQTPPALSPVVQQLAEACAICNDAGVELKNGSYKATGLPTEAALRVRIQYRQYSTGWKEGAQHSTAQQSRAAHERTQEMAQGNRQLPRVSPPWRTRPAVEFTTDMGVDSLRWLRRHRALGTWCRPGLGGLAPWARRFPQCTVPAHHWCPSHFLPSGSGGEDRRPGRRSAQEYCAGPCCGAVVCTSLVRRPPASEVARPSRAPAAGLPFSKLYIGLPISISPTPCPSGDCAFLCCDCYVLCL